MNEEQWIFALMILAYVLYGFGFILGFRGLHDILLHSGRQLFSRKLQYPIRRVPITTLFSAADILLWSESIENSIEQIRQNYAWKIAEYSTLGNAFLTSALAFVSAVAIATLQKELVLYFNYQSAGILFGISIPLMIYSYCQMKINSFRREFLELYNLLLRIS